MMKRFLDILALCKTKSKRNDSNIINGFQAERDQWELWYKIERLHKSTLKNRLEQVEEEIMVLDGEVLHGWFMVWFSLCLVCVRFMVWFISRW